VPANADPGGDPTCLGLGVDVGVDQRRAQLTGPADRLLVEELDEQLELLLEQPLVVDQVVAEQREALGERAAPDDDLDPAGGDALERGEPLVDPDRVVAAQHGDSGADPHPRRTSCDRGEHDLRSGDRVLRAVVLTDVKTSTPSWSASTASSTTCRMAAPSDRRCPASSVGMSPKVSRPSSTVVTGVVLSCRMVGDAA
jgi:hypothetical protein